MPGYVNAYFTSQVVAAAAEAASSSNAEAPLAGIAVVGLAAGVA